MQSAKRLLRGAPLQAVPVAEPEWSGAHVGLCLYIGRLLQPLWEEAVIGPPTPGEPVLESRIAPATLEVSCHWRLAPPSQTLHGSRLPCILFG